nr:Chain D, Major capsid protein [Saccharomyces cerevisiae virus L-A]
MLRFVGSRRR